MLKTLKTKLCKINYSDSLQQLVDATIELLETKIIEYQELFEIQIGEQIIVNYFDKLDEFRNFIYNLRGEKESLPEYAKGTYDRGMVNAYIEPEIQLKRLYTSSHELFHVLYMKHVLKGDYSKRIVWYDEGMAQFVSGEKNYLDDINEFKKFYHMVKNKTKKIPVLNNLEHNNSFYNEDYDGYDLSYLIIRYLFETLNNDEFKKLMSDFEEIKQIGNDAIYKMFDYFDKKINNINIK